MKKRVQDEKPPRSKEVSEWLDQEIAEQEVRYGEIVAEMEGINEERQGWYANFLDIIQNKGFNMNGDTRIKIKKEDVPERPDCPDADKVIW